MRMLLGLGDDAAAAASGSPPSPIDQAIDGFLLASPQPSSSDVASFLKTFAPGDDRNIVAHELIAKGVAPDTIASAMRFLNTSGSIPGSYIRGLLTVASASASAFHGYRRNQSVGWGIWWFASGLLFPIFTPVIAVAQGFGKRKGS